MKNYFLSNPFNGFTKFFLNIKFCVIIKANFYLW